MKAVIYMNRAEKALITNTINAFCKTLKASERLYYEMALKKINETEKIIIVDGGEMECIITPLKAGAAWLKRKGLQAEYEIYTELVKRITKYKFYFQRFALERKEAQTAPTVHAS